MKKLNYNYWLWVTKGLWDVDEKYYMEANGISKEEAKGYLQNTWDEYGDYENELGCNWQIFWEVDEVYRLMYNYWDGIFTPRYELRQINGNIKGTLSIITNNKTYKVKGKVKDFRCLDRILRNKNIVIEELANDYLNSKNVIVEFIADNKDINFNIEIKDI